MAQNNDLNSKGKRSYSDDFMDGDIPVMTQQSESDDNVFAAEVISSARQSNNQPSLPEATWLTKNGWYSYSIDADANLGNVKKIDCTIKINGRNVEYVAIATELALHALKPEQDILKRFDHVSTKISQKDGQDGIKKLLKGNSDVLIELKLCRENVRLYTEQIYQNADNKCLIVFDERANTHTVIKKILQGKNYEIPVLDSYAIGEYHNSLAQKKNDYTSKDFISSCESSDSEGGRYDVGGNGYHVNDSDV
jgi:hypothetical protein